MAAGVRSISRLPYGARAAALATCAVADVASKMIPDLVEALHREQAVEPLGGGRHAEPGGAGEAVGSGVDADHRRHLEDGGVAQHLDHEIGPDVAGTDDGHLGLLQRFPFRRCPKKIALAWPGSARSA